MLPGFVPGKLGIVNLQYYFNMKEGVCARRFEKNCECNVHCKKVKWRQNGGLSLVLLQDLLISVFIAKYNQTFVTIECYVVVR